MEAARLTTRQERHRTKTITSAVRRGLVVDACRAALLHGLWTIAGAALNNTDVLTRRVVASVLVAVAWLVNVYSLFTSYRLLGRDSEQSKHGETLLGLFFEITSLMQAFGLSWCTVRLFALDSSTDTGYAFLQQSFLTQLGTSIFEMSLVMTGVGWTATPPMTLGEMIVAWLTATVGGILLMNMFLVAVVLGRRGWWIDNH